MVVEDKSFRQQAWRESRSKEKRMKMADVELLDGKWVGGNTTLV